MKNGNYRNLMDMEDVKLWCINSLTLSVTFLQIEQWFKILLLMLSILYTILKITQVRKDIKKDKR